MTPLNVGGRLFLHKISCSMQARNAKGYAMIGATPINKEMDTIRNVLDPQRLAPCMDHEAEVVAEAHPNATRGEGGSLWGRHQGRCVVNFQIKHCK